MDRLKSYFRRILPAAAAFVLLLILMSFSSMHAYADNPQSSVTPLYTAVNVEDVDGESVVEDVYVLNISGKGYYLFLPSEADTGSIKLYSLNGDRILFRDGENSYEELDLDQAAFSENNILETNLLIFHDPEEPDSSETMHLNIMKGENMGTVYYVSDDRANNGMRWVDANRNNRGTGTAVVTDKDGKAVFNGKIDDIHIRGSSAIIAPKKSYQIKLSKKNSLVAGTDKGKKWVLLAQYYDPLRLSDKVMKDVANASGEKYSAREDLINLYYDGVYRGVYNLSEKNEIKSNRINITDMEEYYETEYSGYGDSVALATGENKYGNAIQYQKGLEGPSEPGGYLIEMNSYFMDQDNGFIYKTNDPEQNFAVKIASPELGSKDAVTYISEYFQEFSDAIYGSDGEKAGWNTDTERFYYDYCDLDSLADSYLLQTICSNGDGFWKSQFFYKDVGEIMYSGPIWDMDNSFGMLSDKQADPNEDVLREKPISDGLINIPSFRYRLRERYFAHYQSIMASLIGEDDKVMSFMDLYRSAKPDLLMDAVLWPVKYKTHDGSLQWAENESLDVIAEYRADWIRKHKDFLDSYFGEMDDPEEKAHIYGNSVYKDEELHKRICVNCGDELTSEHVWDDGIVRKDASCTEEGILLYTCTSCGGTKEAAIPEVPHSIVFVEGEQPTYESGGSKEHYICSICGKLFEDKDASIEIAEDDIIIPEKERPKVDRFYGQTRYETAIKTADAYKAQIGAEQFDAVIIACGTNYADALAGSYLSSVKKAPILLVRNKTDEIKLVQDYIKANLREGGMIYLLGGTAVVPDESVAGLSGFKTRRLWGKDRYATNVKILQEAGVSGDEILVASGTGFADSLSASATGKPILLVKNTIQDSQKAYVGSLKGKEFYIIGGEGAVSSDLETYLRSLGTTERLGGATRYDTSVCVAQAFFPDPKGAVLAYGANFPDGLCGGSLANAMDVPLLLAAEGKSDAAESFMVSKEVGKAAVLGGPTLISDATALGIFGIGDEGSVIVK